MTLTGFSVNGSIFVIAESTYVNSLDAKRFLEEALRMREFDHPHILRLIGIALDKEDLPLVVLPFMKHGDLLSYIRNEENVCLFKDLHKNQILTQQKCLPQL